MQSDAGVSIIRLGKDRPELSEYAAELEKECFADPWSREAIEKTAGGGSPAYVLMRDGRPAAWAASLIAADEGEIGRIAVGPQFRKRGLGTVLLKHMLEEGGRAGVRAWFLEVRESNEAAVNLYKSAGFVPVGRRRAYYSDPVEDGIIMKRQEELNA